jgi:predicted XRE-type DNA-binding protein
MVRKIKSSVSSGNVFADLNLPNPEELLAKAQLAQQINHTIKQRGLTQEEAAVILGVDQPKISALACGKLSGFSIERLFKFLNELGQDITIQIAPKAPARKRAHLTVNSLNPELTVTKNR